MARAQRQLDARVYRDTDGKVHLVQWQVGGAAAHADLTALAYAPAAMSRPFGFANGSRQHVVYQGSDEHIQEIYW